MNDISHIPEGSDAGNLMELKVLLRILRWSLICKDEKGRAGIGGGETEEGPVSNNFVCLFFFFLIFFLVPF